MREKRRRLAVLSLVLVLAPACGGEKTEGDDQGLATTVRQVAAETVVAIGTVGILIDISATTVQLFLQQGGWTIPEVAELVVENPDCLTEVGMNPPGMVVTQNDDCVFLANNLRVTGQVTTLIQFLPTPRATFNVTDLMVGGQPISGQVITSSTQVQVHLEFKNSGATFDVEGLSQQSNAEQIWVDGQAEVRRRDEAPFPLSLSALTWATGACLPASGEFAPADTDEWRVFLNEATPSTGMADVALGEQIASTKLFARCE